MSKTAVIRAFVLLSPFFAATGRAQQAPQCQSHGAYFFVVRDRTDSVANDILVKPASEPHKCVHRRDKTDYEIKGVNANHSIQVSGPYAFFSGGTGPDGGDFVVYDLEQKRKLYEHGFINKDVKVENGTVSFTQYLGMARRAQCPRKYDEVHKQGFSVTLEVKVSFKVEELAHPESIKLERVSQPFCDATQ